MMKRLMAISFIFWISATAQGVGLTSPLNLGPEQIVQANGADIVVPGYSVPSFIDWNGDKLKDLVIGQGSGTNPPGKVRIYLNVGNKSDPKFEDYFYAKSQNADITVPASGCMGCFPRVVYWDADDRKDLLMGLANGAVVIFLNIGTDSAPVFDSGSSVTTTITESGSDLPINVSGRATPTFVDWNDDDMTDLIVGALDGKIHIYVNCGCGGAVPPHFRSQYSSGMLAQENGRDIIVPSQRSSPEFFDLDGDGYKDLLTGNTDGQLLFYRNVGTNAEPNFSGYVQVESNGVPINIAGMARSRPFVCFWTEDAYPDVLIGASDGRVYLYQGIPEIGDLDADGDIDCVDFALFAIHWRHSPADCGRCDKADLNGDGNVDIDDLRQLAAKWLKGAKEKTPTK